jgi:hypothetical protein
MGREKPHGIGGGRKWEYEPLVVTDIVIFSLPDSVGGSAAWADDEADLCRQVWPTRNWSAA